jgi:hypothetical protein
MSADVFVRKSLLATLVSLTMAAAAGCHDSSSDIGSAVSSSTSSTTPSSTTPTSSSANTVTLSWQPPTENTNGTSLSNLSGYRIYYGESPGNYTTSIEVANPGVTTYVVENLRAGQYYFSMTSYTSSGAESGYTPEVSTIVD